MLLDRASDRWWATVVGHVDGCVAVSSTGLSSFYFPPSSRRLWAVGVGLLRGLPIRAKSRASVMTGVPSTGPHAVNARLQREFQRAEVGG